MTTKPNYKRPERDELEPMIRLSGVITASWRFCGNSRESNLIRQWCEELDIPIPAPKKKAIRPETENLLEVLNGESTIRKTSEYFGVTTTTIRKWMKHYNIRRSYDSASQSSRFKQFGKPAN